MLLPLAIFLMLVLGTGTAQAATITIETKDNEFDPVDATAAPGDTLEFRNTGVAPHNAVSEDGSINIPLINPGETKTATVEEAGTIDYVCQFHIALGMVGSVIVEGAAGAPAGEASPEPEEGATNPPGDQAEAEGNEDQTDPEGGDEGGEAETDAGGTS
ncbi:MAG TPA: plastocyanin/azurin family copper-binding protein, partial [Actinomycetota bacterium]|nr:plastocyanin/azurin family copper-binding protein [Actinomycetota bacterium]